MYRDGEELGKGLQVTVSCCRGDGEMRRKGEISSIHAL